MINKLFIGSLLLLSATFTASTAIAEISDESSDTRVEKYENLTESESLADSETEVLGEIESSDDMKDKKDMEGMEMGEEIMEDSEAPNTRTEEMLNESQPDGMDGK